MPPPQKGEWPTWQFGPTGIIGMKNAGGDAGDQIRVIAIAKGSPADGRVLPGDVLLGVHGKRFSLGGSMNRLTGDAIIEAETEAGKGLLTVLLWRDRNWLQRTGKEDVFGVDIETMFKEAQGAATDDVYEWEDDTGKAKATKAMAFDKYPIDGVYTNITLQLEVMGTYSDTSPWDCPVVAKVRDNALKVIAERMKPVTRGRQGGDWPDVLALVASGKPEYVKLAKDWVHRQDKLCHDMDYKVTINDVTYRGMQSWHHGFGYLEMAIYYDATGDEFILPEVRKRAICAALGQNGGGSWGHTFAFPEFNGGMLHRNNPGYGAMNNAGGRCFFLLCLAKKAGIEHPEIDAAIARARRFFGTFVDKGCIPYGYHSPWPSDDSNGKNYGPAYAFYTLGEKYKAKYFSMHSAHASFTRRGGHGSATLWYYTPLSAHMAGPAAVQAYMRNMRYFYTLSRCHDGSFVFLGEQSGIGGRGMRNATAYVTMHLSRPLEQLIITGKNADPNFYMTDEELNELLISARGSDAGGQIQDPVLLAKIGKPWNERGTDELIDMLDHYFPNMRRALASELGKRYAAGEQDIVSKLVPLLANEEDRMRDGACKALSACGKDAVLAHMSKMVVLLKDEAEFVRMQAVASIGEATEPGDKGRELAVLKCIVDDHPQITADNGNVRTASKAVLLPWKKKQNDGPTTLLTTSPFKAGYDEDLVRRALERIVTMDPQGHVPGTWDKEALLKLAGPVTFSAEELQVNDAMFGGARKKEAQALLSKHGYREATEGNASNLRKRALLERSRRVGTTFKDAYITPAMVKKAPGLFKPYLDALYLWQLDDPTHTLSEGTGKGLPPITTPLNLLIEIIEKDNSTSMLPSIRPDVEKMFQDELMAAGGSEAQIALCRKELEDIDRKNFFRKMAAMSHLEQKLGLEAVNDISPFLGHEQWRIEKHANDLAVRLVKNGAGPRLIQLYDEAQARVSGLTGNWNAAGILAALAEAEHKPALETARAALKHHDPVVRCAAIQAVFKIGGDPELKTVFAFIRSTAQEREDFHGAEEALLSKKSDLEHVKRVSGAAITLLPQSPAPIRRSLAWVLGQFGGSENLAAIEKAASASEDARDIAELVRALAYSPDRSASSNMLTLVKAGNMQRDAVAQLGVHRMVGRNGWSEVDDKERVSFGRQILNLKYDGKLISFFGRVHTASSLQLLFDVMQKGGSSGGRQDSTSIACMSLIECAEGIENPSKADSELAATVLANVVEYIEVTHLRGGYKVKVIDHIAAGIYATWQGLQARAGQALLKFHKPKEKVIPTFNDVDLDI
jgi:HEAT repeat protein